MPLLETFENFRAMPLAARIYSRRRLKVRLTLKFQRCPVVPEIQVFPGRATIFPFCLVEVIVYTPFYSNFRISKHFLCW